MSGFVTYCGLDEFKMYIGQVDLSTPHPDDNVLKRFLVAASRAIEQKVTNGVQPTRFFYPRLATYTFDHPEDDPSVLNLRDDLLELTTLTTANGTVTISSPDYLLFHHQRIYGRTPYSAIRLQPNGTASSFSYTGTPYGANSVAGVWGYHDDWPNAFEDSTDTVVDNPLSSSTTTITVNDVDGDDLSGISPRFQSMQLLKIEDEYVWVTNADVDTNTLTVRRGVCGTTAAEHIQATPISIYRPMANLRLAFEMWAYHLYRRRDSIGTPDQRPLAAAKGILVFPPSVPKEVEDILMPYMKDAL